MQWRNMSNINTWNFYRFSRGVHGGLECIKNKTMDVYIPVKDGRWMMDSDRVYAHLRSPKGVQNSFICVMEVVVLTVVEEMDFLNGNNR